MDGKRNERTRVMDGREVEDDVIKWTVEVIQREIEEEALKKRTSRSADQRAEAQRLNPPHELYCMFSV